MLVRIVLSFAIGYVLGNWGKETLEAEVNALPDSNGVDTDESADSTTTADDAISLLQKPEKSSSLGMPADAGSGEVTDTDSADNPADDTTISEPEPVADNLAEINGIGPVFAKRLAQGGIINFQQLATADENTIYDLLKVAPWQKVKIDDWQEEAQQLLASR